LVFEELYDLADDPDERYNLTEEKAAVRNHMALVLDSLRMSLNPAE
jgi:hypothetical protein